MKKAYTPPTITTYGDIRELTKGRWRWGDGDGVFITVFGHQVELPLQS